MLPILPFNMLTGSKPEQPDSPPKHLYVGAINPFALVEAVLGRKLNWTDPATLRLMSSILQTDYEELFDMRFGSILYAGTRLSEKGDKAELIPAEDMHTLTERDLVTPDFSRVEKLGDLEHVGLKDLAKLKVKHAVMSNGNLRMTLEPHGLGKTLCASEMTSTLRELCTPFRIEPEEEWTPPNATWTDVGSCTAHATLFSNPVQGATNNSWLIAALMSVAWSDPAVIKHCTRRSSSSGPDGDNNDDYGYGYDYDDKGDRESNRRKSDECSLSVKFYSKGGDKDASTATVTVNCELPVNNSSSLLMYCRPSCMNSIYYSRMGSWSGEMWPALYEKAFAKWLTEYSHDATCWVSSEHPDLTQTSHGDPVKAMAQITDKESQYFNTSHRSGADLLGLVRAHSFNQRTIYPTVAWTHPSGDKFRGCTLVGNMAYSVLGWAAPQERKQYIVLRHPWGATEPDGMTSYPGVVSWVDTKFWPPIELVDRKGVFAIETGPFKEYFAGMGVAK
jgi:hypothetical protein